MTPGAPFRFVQSGDFDLDQPLGGLATVPKHLRELFLTAPRQAVQNVFETAILHEVDFVLLTGNLLDVRRSSPACVGHLLEQFDHLHSAGIEVYWLGGESDPPAKWPSSITLPPNVHTIGPGKPLELLHRRDDLALCSIVAQGHTGRDPMWGQFRPDPGGLFTIGMAHGQFDPASIPQTGIAYWAIGGRQLRDKVSTAPATILYSGAPQGRLPTHCGQRCCTVVDVDEAGAVSMEVVPTDVCRWQSELVEVETCEKVSDLVKILKNRMRTFQSTKGKRQLLIDWRIVITGNAPKELVSEKAWGELTDQLNKEFGAEAFGAWTYELTIETSSVIPEAWYQEQTISGDFLRLTRELAADPSLPIDVSEFLADSHRESQTAEAVAIETREDRRRVLQESRRLGVQLLRSE